MKRIFAREEYCLACRLCEIHCIVKHSKSKRVVSAMRDEKDTLVQSVRVEEQGRSSFAVQCRHCKDAPCIDACIAGAMARDPGGAVACNSDRCVGCWSCIMVCPAGAITKSATGKVASKCDLCADSAVPACVENCPNEALIYEEG